MKNRTLWMLAILTAVTGAAAGTLRAADAGGLLDQGLGGSSAEDKATAPKTDASKADPAKAEPAKDPKVTEKKSPVRIDPINPDAANAVDSDDLVKKLTGGKDAGGGEGGAEQMLDEILVRMGDSAKRLHERDPGGLTQEIQRRIVVNLDQLIEMAKKQESSSSSKSSPGKSSPGSQRQENKGSSPGQQNPGGTEAAQQSTPPGGGVSDVQTNQTDIRERAREWGGLPERERDLIVNSAKEEPLPSYRDLVQRYYESLAEIGKNHGNNK